MDCLRSAIRYGARDVVCVYRRGESEMPCGRHEYENAREEGAQFIFNALPLEILHNAAGIVSGLRLIQTEPGRVEGDDRPAVVTMPGSESEIEADIVILALGFEPAPCPRWGGLDELALNTWGGLQVDDKQQTSLQGVYAGGDLTRGPSSILLAVRDARQAAAHIHVYLSPRLAKA